MLSSKEVTVTWQRGNCTYFKEKGYDYTKIGDEFRVRVGDLKLNSRAIVEVECDYCHQIYKKSYKEYNTLRTHSILKKDSCGDCRYIKVEEGNLKKHGVKHVSQMKITKEKNSERVKDQRENDLILKIMLENRDNMSYEEIGKLIGKSSKYIANRLYKLGLNTDGTSKLRKELTKEVLYDLYVNQQLSYQKIARKYGTTAGNVQFIAQTYKISSRSKSEANLIGAEGITRYNFDYSFFSKQTKSMFYVLGLLATDGFVYSKTNQIGITLIDYDVIDNIKKLIRSEKPIKKRVYTNKKDTYTIDFSHPQTKEDLKKWGVIPNKSLVMKYPQIPNEFERYYIRGLFEGDGWFSIVRRKKKHAIKIGFVSGSIDFISSLHSRLRENGFEKFKLYNKKGYYTLNLSQRHQCESFCEWLYKDCIEDGLFMERKYKKVTEFLN